MRTSSLLGFVAGLLLAGSADAQATAANDWTLQECIQYAIDNNISVAQAKVRMEQSRVDLASARGYRLPTLDAGIGGTMNFGRGADRDGVIRDRNTFSSDIGASTSMTIFDGFQITHSVRQNKLSLQAAIADMAQVSDDVSLNVTSRYLDVLFNRELLAVAERQVAVAEELVASNRLKYEAGKIAESDLVESRAQLARDRYAMVQQQGALDLSLLDLKQLLELPADTTFVIAVPLVNDASLAGMAGLRSVGRSFDDVVDSRPGIRAAEYKLQASQAGIRAARGGFYPSLSARAGYSNGYYRSLADGDVNAPFRDQLKNNGSEYVGLSLNIPLFNRTLTRQQVRSARLNASSQELGLRQARAELRKQIEQAYQNATSAWEQYLSASESATAALKSFEYEQERLTAGTTTLYDYDLSKSRLERAQSEMVRAKWEYILRTKVIKFYEGEPLTFDY